MIKFLLYLAVLINVFVIVLATDTETCDDDYSLSEESKTSDDDYSLTDESSNEEDESESIEAYPSSCSVYEPPIPANCKGDPNAYVSSCANNCPNQCRYLNKTNVPCPEYCQVNGCQCKKGYVLDDNTGKCVLPEQCSSASCKGDPNAYVSSCANNCPNQCMYLNQTNVACTKICEVNGCQCKKGYILDDNTGKCVLPEQCSPASCKGDPNAYVSSCANNCPNQCRYLNKTNVACRRNCEVNGCQCKKGYVLDDNTGKCVLPEQCSPTCGENEVYSSCSNGLCQLQDCTQYGAPLPFCPRFDKTKCTGGCACKSKHLRNPQGICVPQDECPSYLCAKINHEVYSNCTNGGNQIRNCSQLGKSTTCNNIDPADCIRGCICEEGYLRADDGTCIRKKDCESCKGDPNAYVSNCANNCPNQCMYLNRTQYVCPAYCENGGCQCKKGYVLDDNTGKCVLPKHCTRTCGVNEVYSKCSNGLCQLQDCTQYGAPIPFCPRYDKTTCIGGCVCKSKHLRNPQGICVPQEECPSFLCPKINHEVYSNCTNRGNQIRNCSQLGKPIPCTKVDPTDCIRGCICVEGYLRADDGTCIPKKDCESCKGDPNAYVSNCANNCPNLCSYLNKTQYVCPAYCENGGCQCKKGFVFDDNTGKCVLPKQCTPTCGVGEVYSSCANCLCKYQYCTNYKDPVMICKACNKNNCKGGCVCQNKFLRNPKGICVPQDECPSYLCPKAKHEVYSNCTNEGCQPQNCSQVGLLIPCIKRYPANCKKGCLCEEGYLRADDGTCIPAKECPIVCRGENEVFSNCTNGGCAAKQCSELGYKMTCVDYNSDSCVKGCTCIDGYMRDDNGICIPSDQCPSCGRDPNAQQGCGNCGRSCSDYMNTRHICPLRPCFINECQCKPDYVYDGNIGRCVLPKDCTPTCELNEVFSNCYNGGCVARNCSQKDSFKNIQCSPINPKACKKGCICKENYLRAKNGTCIPKDQCQADSDGGVINCSEALQRLYDGITMFTGNFFSIVVNKNIGKSVVMSPFSVLMVTANLAFGVKNGGNSFNQLMSVLNLKSKNEMRCTFPELIMSFKSQNESELNVAENVFVSLKETLDKQFANDTSVVLGGETENIDFSDANQAADTINKRIEQQTKNRIKNLVSPSMFSSLTKLVITNAIYFLGAWVKQFDTKQTRKGDFFGSNNQSVQKDFMYRKGSFKYAEITQLDAKVLQIPYKGENFTYVAFLPNAIDGSVNLVEKLREPATLNGAIKQLSYKTVSVNMPRSEIESNIDLPGILKELGLTDIFDAIKSDLDEIIESKEKLAVSAAVHKAYCKVDEVGTEAAAATAAIVGATAVQQQNLFNADHPFVFYICLHDTPLFCGVVNADSK